MRVNDLPVEQGYEQYCFVSGTGWFTFSGEHFNLQLVNAADGKDVCPAGTYGGFAVAGMTRPYSLY